MNKEKAGTSSFVSADAETNKKGRIIEESRRKRERRYNTFNMRRLFNIPDNEMLWNIEWNRSENKIIVTTLIDYREEDGDI